MDIDIDPHDDAAVSAAIRLELVGENDADLANLPATSGKRADDGDPDRERYALHIRHDGIAVRAATAEGIFRGLTTLRQIIATTPSRQIPAADIRDTPRFAWRGFSFDVCRTFFTVDEVKQVIDLLALYKFNVLHLHLTDSEGWRIEIATWPKLTEIGSDTGAYGRPGGFYTQQEFRDLVQYAGERCITIVPEIEMPGHSGAIFRAYPELAGDAVSAMPDAAAQPAMLQFLHPDHPQVFSFITDVLAEVAAMSPAAYLHIGGDEAFGMPEHLYIRFIERARPIVSRLGKKLVAWQEAARAGLGAGDIGQYWIQFDPAMLESVDLSNLPEGVTLPDGSAITPEIMGAIVETMSASGGDVPKLIDGGADILMSLSTRNYLDTPYAEASADPAQQAELDRLGMKFYPATTVAEFFDWDPLTVRDDVPEDRIVGVEAAIWCETIADFQDLCFMLLPRLAGNGERGWSARNGSEWSAYRERLAAQPVFWKQRGLNFFRSSLVDWA